MNWARDLRYHFPFLAERDVSHPYQLFYFIWKLSFLFGQKYAHHSLAYEALVDDPDSELTKLLTALEVRHYDLAQLRSLIDRPSLGKWKKYADVAWFKRHEAICEQALADFVKAHD